MYMFQIMKNLCKIDLSKKKAGKGMNNMTIKIIK